MLASAQEYKRQEAIALVLHEQEIERQRKVEHERLVAEAHAKAMEKKQAALAIRVAIAKTTARLDAEMREILLQVPTADASLCTLQLA